MTGKNLPTPWRGLGYRWLRYALAGLLAFLSFPLVLGPGQAIAAESQNPGKILIVCYSWSGNTLELARKIQKRTGADLVEIKPVQAYSTVYEEVTALAKEELNKGYLPPIQPLGVNVADYDLILLGSPNWWSTLAPPVMTFLSENDLSGKTVVPFITHGGSRLGKSAGDISRLAPGAIIGEGLAVYGRNVDEAGPDVQKWLKSLGIEAN